ncbi:hypothetical protein [Clostridium celatum]|uniref:hypothetical protein n=1 Tax=Clostridium celatum TaxID=36834 RepID=UPI00319DD4ED
MSEVKKTLGEKIYEKKMSLEKIDKKIKNLTIKKSELIKELKILEMEEKTKQYQLLEISLKESGMTLSSLIATIKKKGGGE